MSHCSSILHPTSLPPQRLKIHLPEECKRIPRALAAAPRLAVSFLFRMKRHLDTAAYLPLTRFVPERMMPPRCACTFFVLHMYTISIGSDQIRQISTRLLPRDRSDDHDDHSEVCVRLVLQSLPSCLVGVYSNLLYTLLDLLYRACRSQDPA